MPVFSIDLQKVDEEGTWEQLQEFMDKLADMWNKNVDELAKKLNVSHSCASNIQYLRTRSQWTQELEQRLIDIDRSGNQQPNICEFP